MNKNLISKLLGVCFIAITVSNIVWGQDDSQARSVTSKAFDSERPTRRAKGAASKKKVANYIHVRSEKNLISGKGSVSAAKPPGTNATKSIVRIGLTVWKGRPAVAGESGPYFKVPDDNDKPRMWIAERVGIDSVFSAQDQLRFAVESNASGYLYVIGRETYSDGKFGAPYAIFPMLPTDDNSVYPGMLFDFPDQKDYLPFLTLDPKKPKYTGEIMTIIISSKPLNIMKLDADNHLKDTVALVDLELGADVEVFSRTDSDDKKFTEIESKATCGAKARELVQKKLAKRPCGDGTRQLYDDDPSPQTMYHVRVSPGQPAVAFIRLDVH